LREPCPEGLEGPEPELEVREIREIREGLACRALRERLLRPPEPLPGYPEILPERRQDRAQAVPAVQAVREVREGLEDLEVREAGGSAPLSRPLIRVFRDRVRARDGGIAVVQETEPEEPEPEPEGPEVPEPADPEPEPEAQGRLRAGCRVFRDLSQADLSFELRYLALRHRPCLAGPQLRVKRYAGVSVTFEAKHLVAGRGEHAFHLAVPAFGEYELDSPLVRAAREDPGLGRGAVLAAYD
jgi:hypothetical protein